MRRTPLGSNTVSFGILVPPDVEPRYVFGYRSGARGVIGIVARFHPASQVFLTLERMCVSTQVPQDILSRRVRDAYAEQLARRGSRGARGGGPFYRRTFEDLRGCVQLRFIRRTR